MALLVCSAGVWLVWRDYVEGRTQFWLGGKPLDVTRKNDSMLFWVATSGRIALVASLIAGSILVLVLSW